MRLKNQTECDQDKASCSPVMESKKRKNKDENLKNKSSEHNDEERRNKSRWSSRTVPYKGNIVPYLVEENGCSHDDPSQWQWRDSWCYYIDPKWYLERDETDPDHVEVISERYVECAELILLNLFLEKSCELKVWPGWHWHWCYCNKS